MDLRHCLVNTIDDGVDNPRRELLGLLFAFQKTYALITAAYLRLADHVDAGADTSAKLSAATGVTSARLERLIRALATAGIFRLDEDSHIFMTPLSKLLKSNEPDSLYWVALLLKGAQGKIWTTLDEALFTPGVPFEDFFGDRMFELLEVIPEDADIFHRSMAALYALQSYAIARAYDLAE